jgi:hypothetical protein
VRTAEVVRKHFPDLKIYARARNRQHAYRLMKAWHLRRLARNVSIISLNDRQEN